MTEPTRPVWYDDRLISVLKANMRMWHFDNGESWLRDNMPTLAGYL